ncbi:Signal transduction histidine kinase CheA [Desulfovibrio sp. DV]|uniref:chemotaxis protein CheA n=1 Tax=Desulfovibrio sp. DV TaxID=1844708 RepID=UPI00094B9421|nr:chemotaxis protein CheA [Desulfovibrio sp. DV]OLN25272.1 Signal transduction histidine kinase CheA [Desulfovibrio sp. DV]
MALDHTQMFREEALELLAEVEQLLLELEVDPDDGEKVARLFRAMHTVKGSGAMFGFDDLAAFTHEVETLWDLVRAGQLAIGKELLDATLQSRDHMLDLLAAPGDIPADVSSRLIGQLRALAGREEGAAPPAGATAAASPPAAPTGAPAAWWLRYRPASDCFLHGVDPMMFLSELAELGQMHPILHWEAVLPLADLDPEAVSVWWDVLAVTPAEAGVLRDVFVFVEDEHEVLLTALAEEPLRQADIDDFKTRLAASGWEDGPALAGELARRVAVFLAARQAAPEAGEGPAAASRPREAGDGAASIRVESARLDSMVDLVGELVIIQSRLSQTIGKGDSFQLRAIAEELQRLSNQLRDEVLGLRMVPIGGIFGTFRRLVRDLADSLGKSAVFIGEGGDTELDKNVIDRLKDPLVHILRNSVDHGIEATEKRLAAGKPAQGTVRLCAEHVGGEVRIGISDDGNGVDLERVRQKAQAQGLLAAGEEADERRLLDFLFSPGFSTARAVSSVSGRGVGMDVVKRNIEAMSGGVILESRPGQGSTITVRLPLTLAIIDGLQVRVGREDYTIPLAATRACLERFLDGSPPPVGTIVWRDRMVPCLSLRRLFGVAGAQPGYERVVMVAVGDMEVGLAVDVVVGQRQAVIKRLNDVYRDVDFVSGTTVNGDGTISLILDVAKLVQFAGASPAGGRAEA